MTLNEAKPLPNDFTFGDHIAEHMLEVHWKPGRGWRQPEIRPLHNFAFSPFSKSLLFGLGSSDGFAAYKSPKGEVLLFRPKYNFNRFINSSREIFFPKFEYIDYIKCLTKLIQANKTWVPDFPSGLYIKPLMFTEEESFTLTPANEIIFTMIAFPFKPIHGSGPIKLMLAHDLAKNAAGGSGGLYLSANYAHGMKYLQKALNAGYQDVLWMDSDRNVTETNTSNFFMVWTNEKNKTEFVTPMLRGSILPGAIRDTIIMVVGRNKEINLRSIRIPMDELIRAGKEKRVRVINDSRYTKYLYVEQK